RMSRIFSYIDNNYQFSIRLQDIALQEGITSTHLSHIFSDNLGITFHDYVSNKRFEHAVRLINNQFKTLSEIAIESGFSDPKYMAQMFLKRLKLTPKEFRRNITNSNYLKLDGVSSILEFHYNNNESIKILTEK
ncbi:MAG: helix-turn-helix domain-containing protein, partial [bacterium]